MKALVVYDSVYGNTAKIAEAIGQALGAGAEVQMVRAAEARLEMLAGVKLLLVGSPTQKFTMLPATRRFLKSIPAGKLAGVKVAAFDTRMTQADVDKVKILAVFVKLFGYAAEPIGKLLQKAGGAAAIAPAGFFVLGTEGPLLDGELERAAGWAHKILAASGAA